MADGSGFFAVARVPIWGVQNSVASAVFEQKTTVEPLPEPQFPQPVSNASGNYTGVIIDCSGLGLKTAMSPVIKNDQGTPIYGYANLTKMSEKTATKWRDESRQIN